MELKSDASVLTLTLVLFGFFAESGDEISVAGVALVFVAARRGIRWSRGSAKLPEGGGSVSSRPDCVD